jgi:hypothetical protein
VLDSEEMDDETKLAALRAAIDEGDASGIADGDVFASARELQRTLGREQRNSRFPVLTYWAMFFRPSDWCH